VQAPPANGTLALQADGGFTYTPNPGFGGYDSFTYLAGDGTSDDDAVVTIQVSSTTAASTWYFGTSGSGPDDWNLLTTPPAGPSDADLDADGNPGVTVKKSGQKLTSTKGEEFQRWGFVAASDLVLDGPVSLRLWSTAEGFHPDHDIDYSIWLEDCAADGTGCTTIASSVNVHTDEWNGGVEDWVQRDITVGSVSHTVAGGRMLRVRLMFDHHDVWIATSAAHPTALVLTVPA
jgi:hypothetical protein